VPALFLRLLRGFWLGLGFGLLLSDSSGLWLGFRFGFLLFCLALGTRTTCGPRVCLRDASYGV